MEHVVTIILALISSGAVVSLITHVFDIRKSRTEVEQLKQQVEAARIDDKIKIDEHIKKQLVEISETYRKEAEDRKLEISQLQSQNEELQKQIKELTIQINQVLSWISYDMLTYQKWLEKELVTLKPDIQLPEYRKPPKFVQEYLNDDTTTQ